MKLIEALKKLKYLEKKASDLRDKVQDHCVNMDYETPVYTDQKMQVSGWIQAYQDLLKEISNLHFRIQKTNLQTPVKIELAGKTVEKTIAEWIIRRRKLVEMELSLYRKLTDKNLREGQVKFPSGQEIMAKIRRYYDPKERDEKMQALTQEPFEIDSKLEILNAITDLVE